MITTSAQIDRSSTPIAAPELQSSPHLSVVVVSRNDNHGDDLQGRMQHFVNGFIAQCRKHQLSAELVFVEWNPPIERPALEDALTWPADFGPVRIRVVTVPPEIHAALPHASGLALFQMIGKNVGIRRARGRYVLATNIDILFDDATVCYLRDRLQDGTLLRANRYDVPNDLPSNLPFDRVLSECHRRWFQVHMRLGTLDARRRRLIGHDDGTAARLLALCYEIQIFGWREPAGRAGRRFGARLQSRWSAIWACGAFVNGRTLAHGANAACRSLQHVYGVILQEWSKLSPLRTLPSRAYWRGRRNLRRLGLPRGTAIHRKIGKRIQHKIHRTLRQLNGVLRLFPKAWALIVPLAQMKPRTPLARRLARMQRLHTNGCGDFTLLSLKDWFRLRGYPEWPIFSWHIDSVFLFAASANGVRQLALDPRYRIYHIDHSKGSGWSHDGAAQLFARLDANGIPYISNELVQSKQTEFAAAPEAAIVNDEDWGLVKYPLDERELVPPHSFISAPTRGPHELFHSSPGISLQVPR